jgi:hypothetical protein
MSNQMMVQMRVSVSKPQIVYGKNLIKHEMQDYFASYEFMWRNHRESDGRLRTLC